ncbi:hypothetical protein M2475_001801 [Breznakia sp. PF5-3]|uniref:hypothetical protein n=1 Tax=unclassified Breznakia TaxID=2623764 RepID=UPI0024051EFD|nr:MULTISPECIES: hypothetical protein [unclassified Breznakia]MDF9825346.1 hypothetical protein [Breznakia sp. PM6-1]MDF9836224.1 hypothetical protein [Breznakia sp. PF5-3]MDF9838536.1 hypothetical protein [Breznakia sp. PFB2-8]MDF9860469.1 hypothetical protein [Breznakia sp. PH5-24]
MQKKYIIIILVVLILGCSNDKEDLNKTCDNNYQCIYVDEKKAILNDMEIRPILIKKLGNNYDNNTQIDNMGITIHENRIYYVLQTYINTEEMRKTTGNYAIDVYTGEVYETNTGEYRKIE